MSNHKYRILCTRPLSGSLTEEAAANGITIDVQHFIQIKPLIDERLLGIDNMQKVFAPDAIHVFTSAHAVTTVSNCYLHQNDTYYVIENAQVCCISGNTRQQAEKVFHNASILAEAPYGKELAEKIVALPHIKEVNFFCGNQRRNELPDTLTKAGIIVNEYVIYENIPTPTVTGIYDGIMFFSPSAVKSFFSVNTLPPTTVCFAIGSTTAKEIQEFTDNKIISSTNTSEESMVQSVIFYFNNINRYE